MSLVVISKWVTMQSWDCDLLFYYLLHPLHRTWYIFIYFYVYVCILYGISTLPSFLHGPLPLLTPSHLSFLLIFIIYSYFLFLYYHSRTFFTLCFLFFIYLLSFLFFLSFVSFACLVVCLFFIKLLLLVFCTTFHLFCLLTQGAPKLG